MKNNQENDYYKNYSNKYKVGFIGGIAWAGLIAVIYGGYKLVEWLFL